MKTIAMLLIALVIAASGVALARYAEADDSPGGVVIGWVLVTPDRSNQISVASLEIQIATPGTLIAMRSTKPRAVRPTA
jgi:hypothetical protein